MLYNQPPARQLMTLKSMDSAQMPDFRGLSRPATHLCGELRLQGLQASPCTVAAKEIVKDQGLKSKGIHTCKLGLRGLKLILLPLQP